METTIRKINLRNLARAEFEVRIIKVETPDTFYVQLKNGADDHEELNEYLQRRMERIGQNKSLFMEQIFVGMEIVTKERGKWYRGIIEEIKEERKIIINLKDIGRRMETEKYNCYELEERFKETPWQANKCSLALIEPRTSRGWTDKDIKTFKYLIEGYKGWIKIKECINEHHAVVELTKAATGLEEAKDVVQEMIKRECGRRAYHTFKPYQFGMLIPEDGRKN
ncbi:hypothetical protein PUN28_002099 [Cardiocondyla obscurior]|uniref:Tudor domain-containing protein n=1 Tax=Cardiocondyla obscurior TaxID=286306 RepID=A0AAW2GSU0_9HYME